MAATRLTMKAKLDADDLQTFRFVCKILSGSISPDTLGYTTVLDAVEGTIRSRMAMRAMQLSEWERKHAKTTGDVDENPSRSV